MNLSRVVTNSVTSVWFVPLGQTPDYLDPQSQEALHEVDVSGMVVRVSFDQPQRGRHRELDRWMTEQGASHDTD